MATNGWFAPTVLASFAELHLVDAPPSFDGLLAKSLHLRWTAEEGLRQSREILGDGSGGYGSGSKTELADWCNGRNISRKLKLLSAAHTPPSPMSEEQLNAFLEKVKADTSLQEKLKAAASPEAAVEIAKEAGFAITAEDLESMQSAKVELSDKELDGAAGGNPWRECEQLRHYIENGSSEGRSM